MDTGSRPGESLRSRILRPHLVLFIAVFAAAIWISATLVANAVEARILTQCRDVTSLVVRTGFPLNSMTAHHLKAILGAEVIVFEVDAGGQTRNLITTDPGDAPQLPSGDGDAGAPPGHAADAPVIHCDRFEGVHRPERPQSRFLYVHAATLAEPPGAELGYIFREEEMTRQKRSAVLPLVALFLAGLIAVVVLGWRMAWTLARPITELAARAKAIAAGARETPAHSTGTREIEDLSRALSHMVAELRRHEETLVRSEKLAAIGQMTGAVAHEIRNPLAAMKLTVQMLVRGAASPADREALDVLDREIARLQFTVDELFDLAQPVTGEAVRSPLEPVVSDVLRLLDPEFVHRRVTCRREFQPAPEVRLDPRRFPRVIMNLCRNAIQAMPEGGTLTVSIAPTSGGGARVIVRDSGPGLSDEVKVRLFEPFVSTKPGGVGLGLVITKRLVEEHGGRLDVGSDSGGSTFTVSLPAA